MNLKIANENTKRYQNIAEENKETLDTKTAMFKVKEADLREQIEQAERDLEEFDKNVNGVCAQNLGLKKELKGVKATLTETTKELEIVK